MLYCSMCGGLLALESDGDYYCKDCDVYYVIPESQKKLYEEPDPYEAELEK
ncbi:MAG: hypothetical protein IJH53_06105 [Oscillospiraceae bacterium]|nr:hypothetical protein [Oscillospiraceae bacterium]